MRTVRKIAVGYYNSVVLTDDGKVTILIPSHPGAGVTIDQLGNFHSYVISPFIKTSERYVKSNPYLKGVNAAQMQI